MQKFYKKLGILAHEVPKVRVAWALRFFFQIGFVVSWTILTALFVENFGIENLIFFFLADAILFIFGTILASFIAPKLKNNFYFLLLPIFLTFIFLVISLSFHQNNLLFFGFAILAKDLFFHQLNIALYRLNESFFSPAEAQKTMPVIESAITIGTIFGAFFTIGFLKIIETKFVLILWAAALILMGILIFLLPTILRDVPHFCEEKIQKTKNAILESFSGLRKYGFLRHIVLILIFQSTIFTVIEFHFTKDVQSHISHSDEIHHNSAGNLHASLFENFKKKLHEAKNFTEKKIKTVSTKLVAHKTLAHDLGAFHLIFGIISLLVQFLLTSKILEKCGIIGAIIFYFFILFFGILFLIFRFIPIGVLRGIQHGFHSIGESAYHISFYSIFEQRREKIRLFLEGIIKPIGIIFGILIILFFEKNFIFLIPIILTAVIILIAFLAKKSFTKLSIENLEKEENISDKLHSIEVLKQKGHAEAAKILVAELRQKNLHPVVKEKIISTITKINDPAVVHEYTEICNSDESDEIKIKILESLLQFKNLKKYWVDHAFAQFHLMKAIKNLFKNTKNLHLKKILIMNIFKYSPSHEVVPFFLETMRSIDEKLKAICLRSCQIFTDPEIVFYLRPYLIHPCPRIRGHALIALWKFEPKKNLRKVINNFFENDNVESQIAGIYAIGETEDKESEEKLFEFIHHPNAEVRLHALVALAKLKNELAVPMILDILVNSESDFSTKIHGMLDRIPDDIREKIDIEIQFEVSRRALNILQPKKIKTENDLTKLPKSLLEYLRRLYFLARKYDDFLRVEKLI